MIKQLILLILSLLLVNTSLMSTSVAKENILVLGDSLSANYGIAAEQGWVHLLQQRLDQEYPNYQVVNASISGDTTANGLNRLRPALEQHQPKLILLELGANDGLRGFPLTYMKKNLEKIIQLGTQRQAEVILIGMRIPPNYGKKYTQAFYKIYQQLAKQYDLSLVPFMLDGVAGNPTLMQTDGLHPNAKGQPIILNNIYPYLKTKLAP